MRNLPSTLQYSDSTLVQIEFDKSVPRSDSLWWGNASFQVDTRDNLSVLSASTSTLQEEEDEDGHDQVDNKSDNDQRTCEYLSSQTDGDTHKHTQDTDDASFVLQLESSTSSDDDSDTSENSEALEAHEWFQGSSQEFSTEDLFSLMVSASEPDHDDSSQVHTKKTVRFCLEHNNIEMEDTSITQARQDHGWYSDDELHQMEQDAQQEATKLAARTTDQHPPRTCLLQAYAACCQVDSEITLNTVGTMLMDRHQLLHMYTEHPNALWGLEHRILQQARHGDEPMSGLGRLILDHYQQQRRLQQEEQHHDEEEQHVHQKEEEEEEVQQGLPTATASPKTTTSTSTATTQSLVWNEEQGTILAHVSQCLSRPLRLLAQELALAQAKALRQEEQPLPSSSNDKNSNSNSNNNALNATIHGTAARRPHQEQNTTSSNRRAGLTAKQRPSYRRRSAMA